MSKKNNLQATNEEIADQLELMENLLAIKGEDFFRVRAYRQAVEAIAEMNTSLADMVKAEKDLEELPGIGKAIAEKIVAFLQTGEISQLEKLKKEYPPELIKLTRIENLGPKRVGKLYRELQILNTADLKKAIESGKFVEIEGFGQKLADEILKDLDRANFDETRVQWAEAEAMVVPLMAYLTKIKGVEKAEVAGSYRRKKETVGDFDLLAQGKDGEAIIAEFVQYPAVKKIMLQGPTRATVILDTGMQVDLRVLPEESYGAALQYFTGSKAHGIAARRIAIEKGLKLSDYGLFKGDKQVAGSSEEDIYEMLGLKWVPPELREDRGELVDAKTGKLPKLVELKDIKGDFQFHTTGSDGTASLEEMAAAAKAQGLEYALVSDHSKFVGITNGLDEERLGQQMKEIDALNKKLKGFKLLKGTEVDILADGSLALSNSILEKLDVVVAAIHTNFKLTREEQTNRLLSAIKNPNVDIIAHPTGRIFGKRKGYEVDMEKIVAAAAQYTVALEINAHPSRLDIDDKTAKYAKEQGVKIVLSTDSHAPAGFSVMKYGINQARRGWLEKSDVLNTYSVTELLKYIDSR
ncbi:MAG: polymerase [Patescibacteria group bacterium]|nr:polymerase [Patescibacteria group bacterium]